MGDLVDFRQSKKDRVRDALKPRKRKGQAQAPADAPKLPKATGVYGVLETPADKLIGAIDYGNRYYPRYKAPYRSEDPVHVSRWITARHLAKKTMAEWAELLGIDLETERAIELGHILATAELVERAAPHTRVLPRWFYGGPMPNFEHTSLDICQWNVCDVCEAEHPGGKIPAEDEWAYKSDHVCACCGRDICLMHTYTGSGQRKGKVRKGDALHYCPDCIKGKPVAGKAMVQDQLF